MSQFLPKFLTLGLIVAFVVDTAFASGPAPCAMTLERRLSSCQVRFQEEALILPITDEIQPFEAESSARVRKSVDLTLSGSGKAFGILRQPDTILVANASFDRLGLASMTLPLLLKSILGTWPMVRKIRVATNYAGLVEGLDLRVEAIPLGFQLFEEEADALIDFKTNSGVSKSAMHFSGLRIMLHDTTGGDFQESIYKNLAAMGLLVPDENEPFFKRSHVESNVIFVNPHAVTGRLHFDQLEPGWVAAIVELLDQGYEVVLNQGQPNKTDQANTRRIMEAVKVLRPHTQLFHAQRFADIGALKEFISRSRGMLTVESGMSHLGRACGTPTVVIKTPSTGRYWVPKDRRGFRSISYNAFLQQPQTALSDLRELLSADQVNVNPISRIASFAKESSQPAIRLLDSAV